MNNFNIINEVDAILFDIGGTLYKNKKFDSKISSQTEELLAERLNIPITEASELMKNKMKELKKKEGDPSKVRAMADFGISKEEVHTAFSQVNPSDYLLPSFDNTEVLMKLKSKRIKLAVLSNFRISLIEKIFNALDISKNLFDFIISEDKGLPIKPSLIPFQEAIKQFNVNPNRVLYVGDDFEKDIIPASKVGMKTIWINENSEGVTSKIVDLHVSDFSNLLPFIKE